MFIFKKKAAHMYHKLIFYSGQKLKKGWTYPFVALWIWTLIPSTPSPYDQTPALQALHRRLRASTARLSLTVVGWAWRSSVYVRRSSPRSRLIRRRPSTADPALQDPGSNLTFTLSMGFGFCFMFLFFVTNRENPFLLRTCLLLRWSFGLQSKHRRRTL